MARVAFSGQHLNLNEISRHHSDTSAALSQYFSSPSVHLTRFTGYTQVELLEELRERISEQSHCGALSVLSALEAAFQIDYYQRVYGKKKDSLSRAFRTIHNAKNARASFESEILEEWLNHTSVAPQLIGALRRAFKYRHWLAHGRYWNPKLGQQYDYHGVYQLAQAILSEFPLLS